MITGGYKTVPKLYRFFVLILIIIVLTTTLNGCQGPRVNDSSSISPTPDLANEADGVFTYPMDTDTVLTIWSPNYYLHGDYSNYSESPFHSGLTANTGVTLKWLQPYGPDIDYNLNVLFSSGKMPDIIIYDLKNPEYYIDANYIYPLNDYMEEYAPNMWELLNNNPDINKASKTDGGYYYYFPFIRDVELSTFQGLVLREDWLNEQQLSPPTTISEFDAVIRNFHKNYGAVFSFNPAWIKQVLIGAYGIINGYYIDDYGMVQHGLAQESYLDFLTQMRTWYEDGILDPNFVSMDNASLVSLAINNKMGAAVSSCGNLTGWIDAAQSIGNEYNWLPIKNLVLNKGDSIEFSQMEASVTNYGAYITTNCKDIEAAMRFLDWGYSEEGIRLWNFGIEEESYKMINGNPTFTPPEGEEISSWIARYTGIRWGGPSYSLKSMFEQINNPVAVNAAEVWASDTNMAAHLLPNLTSTTDEAMKLASTETLILKYMDDMYYRFIMGQTSLSEFDSYLKTLETMNLPSVLKIKQLQLVRYNSR